MDNIKIVNWFLTRRCNLRCSYCGIVRDYKTKPTQYPDMKYYAANEMTTEFIINVLELMYRHNPKCFHVFYGGEPMLRKDLAEIIKYCNDTGIIYTIITNNTPEVQPMIEDLYMKTNILGLTSSVDPVPVVREGEDSDFKSSEGFKRLVEQKKYINDVVAEITVTSANIHKLYETVRILSHNGIYSSITVIDYQKTPYYDFSNIRDLGLMVYPDTPTWNQFMLIQDDPMIDVHMKENLLDILYNSLPSEYDCKLEEDLHNITIDADGSVRLCLRIRGTMITNIKATNLFMKNPNGDIVLNPIVKTFMSKDKENYCRLCNWTCQMMSSIITKDENKTDDLIHTDRR